VRLAPAADHAGRGRAAGHVLLPLGEAGFGTEVKRRRSDRHLCAERRLFMTLIIPGRRRSDIDLADFDKAWNRLRSAADSTARSAGLWPGRENGLIRWR